MMNSKLYTIIILFFIVNLYGQFEGSVGTLPVGIKWKQINTDTVRIVFPYELRIKAKRIVNMINYMSKNNTSTIGTKFNKIDIFLINKTAVSNGFVRPSPYHSKFFTMSPQYSFGGNVDWLDLLTIHEYRYVMQMNNTNHGVTKWFRKIFGEAIWSFSMFTAIPNWFWEGDAVVEETELSYSGRGRISQFKNSFNDIVKLNSSFGY